MCPNKWIEWKQHSAVWAKREAKCSREIDKKSGIASYCLYASCCLLNCDYNSSAPRTISEPPHQSLFFLLASQTKPNKQTNSLPSSPMSSPFSLPLSSPPPHFLSCHPTPPIIPFLSLSATSEINSPATLLGYCLIIRQHWLLFKIWFMFCERK